jgi:hypothetical protein
VTDNEELADIIQRLERLERTLFPPYVPYAPMRVPPQTTSYCAQCGLSLNGGMGYVCPRSDCPTFSRAT